MKKIKEKEEDILKGKKLKNIYELNNNSNKKTSNFPIKVKNYKIKPINLKWKKNSNFNSTIKNYNKNNNLKKNIKLDTDTLPKNTIVDTAIKRGLKKFWKKQKNKKNDKEIKNKLKKQNQLKMNLDIREKNKNNINYKNYYDKLDYKNLIIQYNNLVNLKQNNEISKNLNIINKILEKKYKSKLNKNIKKPKKKIKKKNIKKKDVIKDELNKLDHIKSIINSYKMKINKNTSSTNLLLKVFSKINNYAEDIKENLNKKFIPEKTWNFIDNAKFIKKIKKKKKINFDKIKMKKVIFKKNFDFNENIKKFTNTDYNYHKSKSSLEIERYEVPIVDNKKSIELLSKEIEKNYVGLKNLDFNKLKNIPQSKIIEDANFFVSDRYKNDSISKSLINSYNSNIVNNLIIEKENLNYISNPCFNLNNVQKNDLINFILVFLIEDLILDLKFSTILNKFDQNKYNYDNSNYFSSVDNDNICGIRTNINSINEYLNIFVKFILENCQKNIINKIRDYKFNSYINNLINFLFWDEVNNDKSLNKINIFRFNRPNNLKDLDNDWIKLNTNNYNWIKLEDFLILEQTILKDYLNKNIPNEFFIMQKIFHKCIFDSFNEILTNYINSESIYIDYYDILQNLHKLNLPIKINLQNIFLLVKNNLLQNSNLLNGLIKDKQDSIMYLRDMDEDLISDFQATRFIEYITQEFLNLEKKLKKNFNKEILIIKFDISELILDYLLEDILINF